MDYSTSKTGKHGHAKAHIIGIDIFTQKKLEELCPTTHNMDVPNVTRTEYQVRGCERLVAVVSRLGQTAPGRQAGGQHCANAKTTQFTSTSLCVLANDKLPPRVCNDNTCTQCGAAVCALC